MTASLLHPIPERAVFNEKLRSPAAANTHLPDLSNLAAHKRPSFEFEDDIVWLIATQPVNFSSQNQEPHYHFNV
jgi:hypothetical protein